MPIRVLMTRDGHQVSESHDGLEGIKMAKACRPDLILCDIGLPCLMNGYDVAQAIRTDSELKNTYDNRSLTDDLLDLDTKRMNAVANLSSCYAKHLCGLGLVAVHRFKDPSK